MVLGIDNEMSPITPPANDLLVIREFEGYKHINGSILPHKIYTGFSEIPQQHGGNI